MERDIPPEVFQSPGVNPTARPAPRADARALAQLQVQLPTTSSAKTRARRLLARHRYLGDVRAVSEPLWYAVANADGGWLGVLVS